MAHGFKFKRDFCELKLTVYSDGRTEIRIDTLEDGLSQFPMIYRNDSGTVTDVAYDHPERLSFKDKRWISDLLKTLEEF